MSSLQQEVYETIRSQLLEGRWRPGDKLPEEKLASELSVNRNPVREALLKLAGEGFLERHVGTGCRVPRLDAKSLQDVWQLRQAVEGMASRIAAEKREESQLLRIEHEHDLLKHPARGNDILAISDCDMRFHRLIVEASGNMALLRVWDQFLVRAVSFQNALFYPDSEQVLQWHRRTYEGHERILTALKQQDANAAETAVRDHIEEGLRGLLQFLDAGPSRTPARPRRRKTRTA